MKRFFLGIIVIAIIAIALLWWRENRTYDGPVQTVKANAEQITRGYYLTKAGHDILRQMMEEKPNA